MMVKYNLQGQPPTDAELDEMLEIVESDDAKLNFTLFLTMLAERIQGGTGDTEAQLLEALQAFDPRHSGTVAVDHLRQALGLGEDDFDRLMRDISVSKEETFQSGDLVRLLKHGGAFEQIKN